MQILTCPGQNFLPDDTNEEVQFLFGGISAQGDPESTVNYLGRNMHGIQNMTPVPLGTGAACTDADAMILQNVDGILGGNTGNADGQNVGSGVSTVQPEAGQRCELCNQILQQVPFLIHIFFERSRTGGACGSKTEDGRGSFCAAAEITLLSAAVQIGGEVKVSGLRVSRMGGPE